MDLRLVWGAECAPNNFIAFHKSVTRDAAMKRIARSSWNEKSFVPRLLLMRAVGTEGGTYRKTLMRQRRMALRRKRHESEA